MYDEEDKVKWKSIIEIEIKIEVEMDLILDRKAMEEDAREERGED